MFFFLFLGFGFCGERVVFSSFFCISFLFFFSFGFPFCSVHFLVPESQHLVWILGEHSATQREIAR